MFVSWKKNYDVMRLVWEVKPSIHLWLEHRWICYDSWSSMCISMLELCVWCPCLLIQTLNLMGFIADRHFPKFSGLEDPSYLIFILFYIACASWWSLIFCFVHGLLRLVLHAREDSGAWFPFNCWGQIKGLQLDHLSLACLHRNSHMILYLC